MKKFQASEKLSELTEFCREKYGEADLLQHNWEHIVRNIYRAERIAEEEENVDMEALYAATMLHDIGVTAGEYENHDSKSRELAKQRLPEFGFSKQKTEKIVEILEEFAETNCESIEAKILSDADKLEKSSLASVQNFFKVHLEWGKDPRESAKDLSRYRKWRNEGFYTERARKINHDGIQERIDFLERYRDRLDEREDFLASEKDLKINLK